MLPWALKMPVGHLVDLFWKVKSGFVYLGALMIAVSLGIMILLLGHTEAMLTIASAETWFITSSLLAPIGYVLQDVVADAMTVEAVPSIDRDGQPASNNIRVHGRSGRNGIKKHVRPLGCWAYDETTGPYQAQAKTVNRSLYAGKWPHTGLLSRGRVSSL